MRTNWKLIITAISTLAIGLLLGWVFFGGSDNVQETEHGLTTEVNGETIWTCSMHPQIRQNEPGDCPICGMDLIPLEEEQGEVNPMSINMSPTAMQLANVSTAIVGNMEPVKTIRLNGKVQEDERLVSSQSSHLPGRIERLAVNFTGEYVNAGQPIAYIYSPELETAQAELFQAYKIRETQPQLYNAAREKLKNWKLTDNQIDRIIDSGKSRDQFPVLADISGYVTEKLVNPGDYVQRGQALFKIANLSKVWVLFDVYESDMPWVEKGDEISFTVSSLPGEEFTGKISFIDPVIDPVTRVAGARVEVSNKDLKLKPEMFVSGTVDARLTIENNAVVIPKSAVMWTGERSVVYVKTTTASGVNFAMREIVTGPALGESFIVESGLDEGEEIAVNGTFSIDAAAQLAGKPSMMNPEGGPSMTGHDHGGTQDPVSPSLETKNITVTNEAKEAIGALALQYVKIQEALADDNYTTAKKAATGLKDLFQDTPMSLFGGEGHDVWMENHVKAIDALNAMERAQNINQFREQFDELSSPVIILAKTFKPGQEEMYVQYCPMANDNTGAFWLSTNSEIENPYFGAAMHSCGETTEKIN